LFYNLLPDGNYDERSQHASMPVTKGEKVRLMLCSSILSLIIHSAWNSNIRFFVFSQWLINMWIWDPVLDHTVADHF